MIVSNEYATNVTVYATYPNLPCTTQGKDERPTKIRGHREVRDSRYSEHDIRNLVESPVTRTPQACPDKTEEEGKEHNGEDSPKPVRCMGSDVESTPRWILVNDFIDHLGELAGL